MLLSPPTGPWGKCGCGLWRRRYRYPRVFQSLPSAILLCKRAKISTLVSVSLTKINLKRIFAFVKKKAKRKNSIQLIVSSLYTIFGFWKVLQEYYFQRAGETCTPSSLPYPSSSFSTGHCQSCSHGQLGLHWMSVPDLQQLLVWEPPVVEWLGRWQGLSSTAGE